MLLKCSVISVWSLGSFLGSITWWKAARAWVRWIPGEVEVAEIFCLSMAATSPFPERLLWCVCSQRYCPASPESWGNKYVQWKFKKLKKKQKTFFQHLEKVVQYKESIKLSPNSNSTSVNYLMYFFQAFSKCLHIDNPLPPVSEAAMSPPSQKTCGDLAPGFFHAHLRVHLHLCEHPLLVLENLGLFSSRLILSLYSWRDPGYPPHTALSFHLPGPGCSASLPSLVRTAGLDSVPHSERSAQSASPSAAHRKPRLPIIANLQTESSTLFSHLSLIRFLLLVINFNF